MTPGLARARVKAPLRQRALPCKLGWPVLLRGPSFKGGPSMTETPCPTVLKYQRSSYTSNAIVFDADLNLHSLEQLRELARDGVQFSIVDVETEEGVTKVLLAQGILRQE